MIFDPQLLYTCSRLPATFALFSVLSLGYAHAHSRSAYLVSTFDSAHVRKNTSLSTPAQLQCSHSGVWEPGNKATSSLPSFPPFWKLSLTFSVHLLMTSEVKCGSCLRKESRLHMAWVTIWANSMAVRAGESQLLLLRTSTQAWIRRMAWKEMRQYTYGRIMRICCNVKKSKKKKTSKLQYKLLCNCEVA